MRKRWAVQAGIREEPVSTGKPMAEPTRIIAFDGVLSEAQAGVIRSIYSLLSALPEDVRQVVAKDLAATYGTAQRDGRADG